MQNQSSITVTRTTLRSSVDSTEDRVIAVMKERKLSGAMLLSKNDANQVTVKVILIDGGSIAISEKTTTEPETFAGIRCKVLPDYPNASFFTLTGPGVLSEWVDGSLRAVGLPQTQSAPTSAGILRGFLNRRGQ